MTRIVVEITGENRGKVSAEGFSSSDGTFESSVDWLIRDLKTAQRVIQGHIKKITEDPYSANIHSTPLLKGLPEDWIV